MGALASLSTSDVSVEPGAAVAIDVRVRNTATVVDQLTVEILGGAAGWARVDPPVVSLFPATEQTVRVTFAPPRVHTTAAGPTPFGVRVTCQEDPTGSTVEEGVIRVGAFSDTAAELVPRTGRGSRQARYELAVDNRGNEPLNAHVSASDPDELLAITAEPAGVVAPPGAAVFSVVRVRPRARFWRGPAQTHQFQVAVVPTEGPAVVVPGTLLQEPVLPRWLPKALAALVALLVLLVIAWFALLRPTVRSAAKDAVKQPIADLNKKVDALGGGGATTTTVAPTTTTPHASSTTTGTSGTTATTPPTTGPPPTAATTTTVSPFGEPGDGRLAVSAPPGGANAATFPIAPNTVFSVTDLVLQNPQGDAGLLQIRRNGQVVLEVALENFRDLDYHFVAPLQFSPAAPLQVRLSCATPGTGQPNCAAAATFVGFKKAA